MHDSNAPSPARLGSGIRMAGAVDSLARQLMEGNSAAGSRTTDASGEFIMLESTAMTDAGEMKLTNSRRFLY